MRPLMRPTPRLTARLTLAILLAGLTIGGAISACDPYNPNLGDEPFKCATKEPRCPDGYECDSTRVVPMCIQPGGGGGGDGGASTDGAVSTSCNPAPDDNLEPNDSTGAAIQLPATMRYDLNAVGICKDSDSDFYFLMLAAGDRFSARADFTHTLGDLTLSLVDQGGAQLRFSDASSATQNFESIDIASPGLPTSGKYYVKVAGKTPSARNTYTLTVQVNP